MESISQRTDGSIESRSNKRRRIESVSSESKSSLDHIKWRSPIQQMNYSTKLVKALNHVYRNASPSSSSVFSNGRLALETASQTLAIADRGRSRWSRAILARRRKIQLKKHKKAAKLSTKETAGSRKKKRLKSEIGPEKPLETIEDCIRVLGKMVPGCSKLSFPSLLDEAIDYMSALEMEVRVFNELITGAGSSLGTFYRPGLN